MQLLLAHISECIASLLVHPLGLKILNQCHNHSRTCLDRCPKILLSFLSRIASGGLPVQSVFSRQRVGYTEHMVLLDCNLTLLEVEIVVSFDLLQEDYWESKIQRNSGISRKRTIQRGKQLKKSSYCTLWRQKRLLNMPSMGIVFELLHTQRRREAFWAIPSISRI